MARSVEPPRLSDVLLVELPRSRPAGHEQAGHRPAVVVGLPERLGRPRFPTLLVVPLTTQIGAWAGEAPRLYPLLRAGTGGLRFDSVALLDHVRGIDASRVSRRLGRLTAEQRAPIVQGLTDMLVSSPLGAKLT